MASNHQPARPKERKDGEMAVHHDPPRTPRQLPSTTASTSKQQTKSPVTSIFRAHVTKRIGNELSRHSSYSVINYSDSANWTELELHKARMPSWLHSCTLSLLRSNAYDSLSMDQTPPGFVNEMAYLLRHYARQEHLLTICGLFSWVYDADIKEASEAFVQDFYGDQVTYREVLDAAVWACQREEMLVQKAEGGPRLCGVYRRTVGWLEGKVAFLAAGDPAQGNGGLGNHATIFDEEVGGDGLEKITRMGREALQLHGGGLQMLDF